MLNTSDENDSLNEDTKGKVDPFTSEQLKKVSLQLERNIVKFIK